MNISRDRILSSNKAIKGKIRTADTSGGGLFAGRSIDLRTDTDKPEKEYILEKLAELLAETHITDENKAELQKLIKHSKTFKEKARHVEQITSDDVMRIRLEIQLAGDFLKQATQAELKDAANMLAKHKDQLLAPDLPTQDQIDLLDNMISVYKRVDSEKFVDDEKEALQALGELHKEVGNTAKAAECYERLLEIEDNKKVALTKLVDLYQNERDLKKRIEGFERILSLERLFSSDTQTKLELLVILTEIYQQTRNTAKLVESYNRILDLKGLDPVFEKVALNKLANIHLLEGDVEKATEYFERIAFHKGIESASRYEALNKLIDIYQRKGEDEKVIKCYEQIASLKGLEGDLKFAALKELFSIYQQKGDDKKAIKCCEQMLGLPDLAGPLKREIYGILVDLSQNLNNEEQQIKIFERILSQKGANPWLKAVVLYQLRDIYEARSDPEKVIECHERILGIEGLALESKMDALGEIYYINLKKGITEVIEGYERVLRLENVSLSVKEKVLDRLIKFNNDIGGPEEVLEYHNRLLGLEGIDSLILEEALNKQIDFFRIQAHAEENPMKALEAYAKLLSIIINKSYGKSSGQGLSKELLLLLDSKPETKRLEILETLLRNSKLWSGKVKLTLDEWTKVINSSNVDKELKNVVYLKSITVSGGLVKKSFLHDPTMSKWNVLRQRTGEIDDYGWGSVKTLAEVIFDTVYKGESSHKSYLAKFFDQCMNSAGTEVPIDEMTSPGQQAIRKRVAACVDYLNELKTQYDLSEDEVEKNNLKKQIQMALDMIAVGGTACPDRAIVFLADLENYIKLLKHPEYLPNVMVQMFKLEAIQMTLIDPNQAENIETDLWYRFRMNKMLGLGLPEGEKGQMLYEAIAKTLPLEEALPILSKAFNVEELLKFTAEQNIFKQRFGPERDIVLEKLQEQYLKADDEDDRELAAKLAQQLEDTEKNFYKAKARELFVEAGFITPV